MLLRQKLFKLNNDVIELILIVEYIQCLLMVLPEGGSNPLTLALVIVGGGLLGSVCWFIFVFLYQTF